MILERGDMFRVMHGALNSVTFVCVSTDNGKKNTDVVYASDKKTLKYKLVHDKSSETVTVNYQNRNPWTRETKWTKLVSVLPEEVQKE